MEDALGLPHDAFTKLDAEDDELGSSPWPQGTAAAGYPGPRASIDLHIADSSAVLTPVIN